MTYQSRTYWSERARKQGASYVGPGGHAGDSAREASVFAEVIARTMPPGRAVLDFGCGPGRLAPALLAKASAYVGLDSCAEGVAMAPALPGARFEHLADQLPLIDGAVDRIAAVVVLQHIVDEDQIAHWCREIRRVLEPGGRVLVIDHQELAAPDEHMRPRGPWRIGELLGMEAESVEVLADHWAAVYR